MKAPLICLSLALVPAWLAAQLPAPVLETVFPPGGQAGTEAVVQLSGTDLDGVTELRASHPGIQAEPVLLPSSPFWPEPRPDGTKFRIRIAPEVPAGIYDLRAAGSDGFSTARLFHVSQAGGVPEALHPGAPYVSREQPFPITLEQVISGKLTAQQANYHQIRLHHGQRVTIRLWSSSLDSRLDGRVAVLDASGRELAAARSSGEREPRLAFTAPSDADYVVTVHDLLFRGGDSYVYRLQISDAPEVEAVYPLAVQQGSKQAITLIGQNLPGGTPWMDSRWQSLTREIEVPANPVWATLNGVKPAHEMVPQINLPLPGVGPVHVALTSLPVVAEALAGTGSPLLPPVEVHGRIDFPGNVDVFRFAAKAGTSYDVEAVSYRQGADTDLALTVQRVLSRDGVESLEPVAESDDLSTSMNLGFDARNRDPGLTFQSTGGGIYQIELRNLGDLYGPAQGYRLVVRPSFPKLTLFAAEERPYLATNQAYPAAPHLTPGGRVTIRVIAVRTGGLSGPVRLSAQGLPAGVRALPSVIWGSSSEGLLVLEAAPDAAPWQGQIEIAGECSGTSAMATTGSLRRGVADVTKEKTSSRRTTGMPLAVTPGAAPLRIEATSDLGEAELDSDWIVKLRINRDGIRGPVTVIPSGLPGFAKPPSLTIAEKESEAVFKIPLRDDGTNKPSAGAGTVVLLATGTAAGYRVHADTVTKLQGWKTLQDAAMAKLDPKDPDAQKAAAAALTELGKLLAAAQERAKPKDLFLTSASSPLELRIVIPAKKAP